ncbi:hypothetical protein U2444_14750, partial [Listeria monocytogenes]|uniref:hypothetical protein n=1 Tax=Listeria monocytogenes TaxID=1639 RepID=UPI002FDC0C7E
LALAHAVRKVDADGVHNGYRVVVDATKLNAVTIGDGYPLPNIDQFLRKASCGSHRCKLDLLSGFEQLRLDAATQPLTATFYGGLIIERR